MEDGLPIAELDAVQREELRLRDAWEVEVDQKEHGMHVLVTNPSEPNFVFTLLRG